MNFPILSSLILLPTIGAIFLFFIKEKDGNNTPPKDDTSKDKGK